MDSSHGDVPHEHDDHAPQVSPEEGPPSEFELTARALQELLEERGLVTADQVRRQMELFDEEYPYRGSQVIARAWTDPEFKRSLLEDGRRACAQLGLDLDTRLIAVENTPDEHNVIVCTLCSCYPRDLLGMPPTWYKSDNYRSRMVYEPRAVLREFGTVIADDVVVRVHDSNADMRYVVIPMRPEGTEGWSEEELASILSRDTLVGVAVPQVPEAG